MLLSSAVYRLQFAQCRPFCYSEDNANKCVWIQSQGGRIASKHFAQTFIFVKAVR
jgi:hypothetical protein